MRTLSNTPNFLALSLLKIQFHFQTFEYLLTFHRAWSFELTALNSTPVDASCDAWNTSNHLRFLSLQEKCKF